MLGNCRRCRRVADGSCSLDDRYEELLLEHMLPADGIIFAMPLYFYGMPGRLKTVFDRLFCYTANSAPQQAQVVDGIMGKKVGVLISCEESYLGATQGVIAQFQELTRYLRQDLVGVVVGNGNSRGEIVRDPATRCRAHTIWARGCSTSASPTTGWTPSGPTACGTEISRRFLRRGRDPDPNCSPHAEIAVLDADVSRMSAARSGCA